MFQRLRILFEENALVGKKHIRHKNIGRSFCSSYRFSSRKNDKQQCSLCYTYIIESRKSLCNKTVNRLNMLDAWKLFLFSILLNYQSLVLNLISKMKISFFPISLAYLFDSLLTFIHIYWLYFKHIVNILV